MKYIAGTIIAGAIFFNAATSTLEIINSNGSFTPLIPASQAPSTGLSVQAVEPIDVAAVVPYKPGLLVAQQAGLYGSASTNAANILQ